MYLIVKFLKVGRGAASNLQLQSLVKSSQVKSSQVKSSQVVDLLLEDENHINTAADF